MNFDFSHLYRTETVILGTNANGEVFSVTVREIPNGEYMDLQKKYFGNMQMAGSKKAIERQFESKSIDFTQFAADKVLLGIVSWTLTDKNGTPVDKGMDAWRALPRFITEQIEKAVEALNPEDEESFRDES